jgi:hypothetical protein
LQVIIRATLNGVEGGLTGQVLAIEVQHVAFQPALDDPIVDSLEGAAFPLAAFCFAEYWFSHNSGLVLANRAFNEEEQLVSDLRLCAQISLVLRRALTEAIGADQAVSLERTHLDRSQKLGHLRRSKGESDGLRSGVLHGTTT